MPYARAAPKPRRGPRIAFPRCGVRRFAKPPFRSARSHVTIPLQPRGGWRTARTMCARYRQRPRKGILHERHGERGRSPPGAAQGIRRSQHSRRTRFPRRPGAGDLLLRARRRRRHVPNGVHRHLRRSHGGAHVIGRAVRVLGRAAAAQSPSPRGAGGEHPRGAHRAGRHRHADAVRLVCAPHRLPRSDRHSRRGDQLSRPAVARGAPATAQAQEDGQGAALGREEVGARAQAEKRVHHAELLQPVLDLRGVLRAGAHHRGAVPFRAIP